MPTAEAVEVSVLRIQTKRQIDCIDVVPLAAHAREDHDFAVTAVAERTPWLPWNMSELNYRAHATPTPRSAHVSRTHI
jgi:hypothetical protein